VAIEKNKFKTLEETGEPAPIDQVEERVEAKMKSVEGKAKEQVGSGLNDKDLERRGRKMKDDAEGKLKELSKEKSKRR
jgi:uncharacterized protein YjbJ (UPF0337 family)